MLAVLSAGYKQSKVNTRRFVSSGIIFRVDQVSSAVTDQVGWWKSQSSNKFKFSNEFLFCRIKISSFEPLWTVQLHWTSTNSWQYDLTSFYMDFFFGFLLGNVIDASLWKWEYVTFKRFRAMKKMYEAIFLYFICFCCLNPFCLIFERKRKWIYRMFFHKTNHSNYKVS